MSQSRKTGRRRVQRQPFDIQSVISRAQTTVASAQRTVANATGGRMAEKRTTFPGHFPNGSVQLQKNLSINLVNCQNVQIGVNNHMVINNVPTARSRDTTLSSDSEDEESEEGQPVDEQAESRLLECHQEVSQLQLQRMAQHVCGGWRRLIRNLGVAEADIDYIYSQNKSESMPEMVFQLLHTWKRQSSDPTIATLASALKHSCLTHLYKYL